MTVLESIIIAIVEGLTEFLPVSSTGHMLLAQGLMGIKSTPFTKAFTVIIQFGAILSVVLYYWRRFLPFSIKGIAEVAPREDGLSGIALYIRMLLAFIPAAVLGFLFEKHIDKLLGNLWVVVATLFVGGIVMIILDKKLSNDKPAILSPKKAIAIGFFQCLAIIPGVSRSMATIFGGMSQGLTRAQAAEFSFFLAIPTMFGATAYKMLDLYLDFGSTIFSDNWQVLLIGSLVAFAVALAAIKYFIGFVSKYGFVAFGYYRIVLAIVFAALMLLGVPISI